MSEENEVTPLRGAYRSFSPETTAEIDGINQNNVKNLRLKNQKFWNSRRKSENARGAENASESSESEGEVDDDEEDEMDDKSSRNQKNKRR